VVLLLLALALPACWSNSYSRGGPRLGTTRDMSTPPRDPDKRKVPGEHESARPGGEKANPTEREQQIEQVERTVAVGLAWLVGGRPPVLETGGVFDETGSLGARRPRSGGVEPDEGWRRPAVVVGRCYEERRGLPGD
jgi:hypothetical protein